MIKARGENHYNWKGGRITDQYGYSLIYSPDHLNKRKNYVREHILVAEKALDKYLPRDVVVHHVDEIRGNNKSNNLVVCENQKYHMLLHKRMRALKACGNPNAKKCRYCGDHDLAGENDMSKNRREHNECRRVYQRK